MTAFARELNDIWAPTPRERVDQPVDNASEKLSQVIKSMRTAPDVKAAPVDRNSPSEDWNRLIERVQNAARQAREADERSLRREEQAQGILFDARKRLDEAADRIHAAEQRAREAEQRAQDAEQRAQDAEANAAEAIAAAEQRAQAADQASRTAEERMHAAEEAYHVAESWLLRVQQTILAEFADMPAPTNPVPLQRPATVSHIAGSARRVA